MSDKHLWNEYVRLEAEVKQLRASIDAAVAAEREACAKLCESRTTDINIAAGVIDRSGLVRVDPHYAGRHAGTKYAAAIRGRGEHVKEA